MLTGQPLVMVEEPKVGIKVYSDASHMGYGFFVQGKKENEVIGSWD